MARLDFSSHDTVDFAVEGGAADALFELGLKYCAGRDVKLDLIEAHKWFNLAAMRGKAEARHYRLEIAREMSKADVAQAQRRAREWLALH
jgi:TPR repeat protein